MDDKHIIIEGKDYEKLVDHGMKHFNARKEDLIVEVLESKKNLFSSYFKLKIMKKEKKCLEIISNDIDNILNENQSFNNKAIDFDFREDGVYIKAEQGINLVDIVTKIDLRRIQSVDLTN